MIRVLNFGFECAIISLVKKLWGNKNVVKRGIFMGRKRSLTTAERAYLRTKYPQVTYSKPTVLEYPLSMVYYAFDANGNVEIFNYGHNNDRIAVISDKQHLYKFNNVDDSNRQRIVKAAFVRFYNMDGESVQIVPAEKVLASLYGDISCQPLNDYKIAMASSMSAEEKAKYTSDYCKETRLPATRLKNLSAAIRRNWCPILASKKAESAEKAAELADEE